MLLRALGSLAAELFSQRFSIWLATVGLIVFCCGWRQVKAWWLPLALLALSIPFPAMITNVLAIPLQYRASHLGTALIEWRNIPVRATGNVISIPGQQLFVAEACSGLRSLTALIALGVMVGGMWLTTVPARIFLLLISIPVAVVINGIRVFLTAFLMYFVDPALGKGFMHESQGWGLFLVSLLILAGITFWSDWSRPAWSAAGGRMRNWQRWIPAVLFAVGAMGNSVLLARRAASTPLVGPIESVAVTALGLPGTSVVIDSAEQRVAGMTSYVLREFTPPGQGTFSIYVGYYDEQHQGKSIHSPKNCLPGAGWEPVEAGTLAIPTPSGTGPVNRYRVAQAGSRPSSITGIGDAAGWRMTSSE